ncbi:creatininase family protein [Kribbella sp. NPDC055110]
MYFVDRTYAEIAELDPDTVAVLPLGAIEQHGPHLPVSTDYLIASSTAEAAVSTAASAGVPVVLLPALAYTKSDEHAWAPGTIWLSWETLMHTLIDIGRSLTTTPIRRLFFLNGHGGNSALGQVACRELRREFGLQTFLGHPSVPVDHGGRTGEPSELGMGIHGGFHETSTVLHLRPDLVHLELAAPAVPAGLTTYQQIGFGKPVSFGWLSDDFGPAGHIGDPTGATAAVGKAHFEAAVETTSAALAEASRFSVS